MSISTGPVPNPPPKKRGLRCLGCGCVVLALLVVLVFFILGSLSYLIYETAIDLTSATPPAIPSFNGTDDAYQSVRQKLADFDHDVMNHEAAKISLSADELNTLISRNPDVIRNHIQTYISFTNTEGRLQASCPSEMVGDGPLRLTGRYASFDISFSVHFEPPTKSLEVTPHALQIGDKPFVGPGADNSQQAHAVLDWFVPSFNRSFNTKIRENPDGATLLDEAKSIEIQGGQLVIETQ